MNIVGECRFCHIGLVEKGRTLVHAGSGKPECVLTATPVVIGLSLVDKVRDELDLAFEIWTESTEDPTVDMEENTENYGRVRGIALCLGMLRGKTEEYEFKQAEDRYGQA